MRNDVTRFPYGVSTAKESEPFGILGLPDPTKYHTYFNDFDKYDAADWTITTTEAGAGSASEALGNAAGGVLVVTNDAADNDADFFNKVGESFKFSATKRLVFAAKFKVSDATQSDVVIGLQITDTTPLAVTDGIYFQKDDGDTHLDFHVTKNSTSKSLTDFAELADDTMVELAFVYEGEARTDGATTYYDFKVFKDGVQVGTASASAEAPDDEELTISFGIQNGEAVSKVLTLDYIFAAQER